MNSVKIFFLVAIICTVHFVSDAQYIPYYNPYTYAALAANEYELQMLNNVRFDENALRQNPVVWENYMSYLRIEASLVRKNNVYRIVAWSGLAVTCISLIPILTDNYEWGFGLLGVGGVAAIVGCIGSAVQVGKYKTNKKEFIYYLRTSNNGVGIIALF